MRRGLGRGEAWEAVNDVPCLGVGDTRALAVVQLRCFSAFCQWPQEPSLSLCADMEAVAVGLGVEAPSRPGKPVAYQLCIKTLRSSRSTASLS